jgi:hypothetical protein
MMRWLALFFFLSLTPAAPVYAQWVPVTAKIRQTRELLQDGKSVERHIKEGNYYRTADGSTLEEWTRVDGSESKAVGHLTKQAQGVAYDLNMITRSAIERRFSLPSGANMKSPPRASISSKLPQITVGGVQCTVLPARVQVGIGQPSAPAGETCFSAELNLVVRNQLTHTLTTGKVMRTLYEMFEIETHKEPDPKLFDLRGRGFTVYSASGPSKPPDS